MECKRKYYGGYVGNGRQQERDELHRTIWGMANDLRGSVDGWDFKQYVLGILFYRYISENFTKFVDDGEHEAGDASFSYKMLSDQDAESAREDLVRTKGYFILTSELFINVKRDSESDIATFIDKNGHKRSVKDNLNEKLELVFKHIEASAQGTPSEKAFKGLFEDLDVNSNKLGGTVAKRNEKLVNLLNGVVTMKLGEYQDNTIDAFGDAYEYLMGMYASNAGKSGGEYFTPQEVSELLTKLAVYGERQK